MSNPVLVIQQTAVCPPGRVGAWLTEAGCTLDVVRPYAGASQPDDPTTYAGLVVLGGDLDAYDDEDGPWLPHTRAGEHLASVRAPLRRLAQRLT